MSKLHIIKASAGSGKTHKLTGFFLGIILTEKPDYFKSILAVTFTNKATEEMKRRIIEQLNVLYLGHPSHYLEELRKTTGWNEEHIREKAGAILKTILHNYSWFTIETIDAFFQRIVRAFTRDIGLPGNYVIELNTRPALEFAVDTLIDGIEEESPLLNWLIRFSEEKILEGKTWNVSADLIHLGEELFKEEFAVNAPMIFSVLQDKNKLEHFRRALNKTIQVIENRFRELSKSMLASIEQIGLGYNDFYYKGKGIVAFLGKLEKGQIDLPNNYVLKLLDGPECWPASDSPNKEVVINMATNSLLSALINIIDSLRKQLPEYYTAKEILKNIFSLGILSDISSKVSQYRHEKNAFILSDAPVFINRIIDHNQTPFIYEKIGNRYRHFLIDEFQDTSGLQWSNFKPLIDNSLSTNDDCLLVGDIKQSIYRWRNSKWEILANGVMKQFREDQRDMQILDTNWRSKEFVTRFNGHFFSSLSSVMQGQFSEMEDANAPHIPDYAKVLSSLYDDVLQNVPEEKTGEGRAEIRFFERDDLRDDPEIMEYAFLDHIRLLLDNNYSPGEIAILVRGKREGQHLAELLIDKNSEGYFKQQVGIISNESLFLNASNAVKLITAALRFLVFPDDLINRGKLINCYCSQKEFSVHEEDVLLETDWKSGSTNDKGIRDFLPSEFINELNKLISLPLYDMVEHLIHVFSLDNLPPEVPYLNTLLDLVHEFVLTNTSDPAKFLDYWEDEGKSKSVPAADAQNAIRIITIHKSKGLEFRAVLIPYCNWSLNQKSNTILWAKPSCDTFDFLPVYPINYSNNLKKSCFADTYFDESFKSYVDNLNLLYVAFTRAVDTLIVYAHINRPDNIKSPVNATGDLIYQSVMNLDKDMLEKHYDNDNRLFRFGKEYQSLPAIDKSGKEDIVIKPSEGEPVIDRLFFPPGGYEFFSERQIHTENIALKGTVLHAILSKVIFKREIEQVLKEAFYEGLLNQDEQALMLEHILHGLQENRVAGWFDGSGEVLNEAQILLPSGESKRPDRIIIYPMKTVVVDYKFGSKEMEDEHKKQVRQYMNLVEEMGYPEVEGYLWYINENEVVECGRK